MTSTVELRAAIWIAFGRSSSLSASARISSENVAENSRFWRRTPSTLAGSTDSTRLMSWMKPMSSMRSASSRTSVSMCEKSTVRC